MKRIAIIGGGYSGLAAAVNLYQLATSPIEILLIDKSADVGLGVAYSTKHPLHLLNVPAGKMSAFDDLPDHFIEWLSAQEEFVGQENLSNIHQVFARRKDYGKYLQSILAKTREPSKHGATVIIKQAEVVDLNISNNISLLFSSGETYKADKVVLALGNPAPSEFLNNFTSKHHAEIIHNPWNYQQLENIPRDASILIVGTGLTMVDVVISLFGHKHQGKIHALSRHGLIPLTHSLTEINYTEKNASLPNNALALSRHLRREAADFQRVNGDWREVVDSIRPVTQNLWQQMDFNNQRRFSRHLRAYWDIHRHRIAPEIAAVISQLQSSGQLNIFAGRVQKITPDLTVQYMPRQQNKLQSLEVQTIINCTGPNPDYNKIQNPLTQTLLKKGIIKSDAIKLGLAINDDFAVLDKQGNPSPNIFSLGPPTKGKLWEIIAVPDIRKQARSLARRLIS